MSFESNRLLRACRLFWDALGPARTKVVAVLALVLVLAAVGVWHLIASATRSFALSRTIAAAHVSPGITPAPLSRRSLGEGGLPSAPTALNRAIAITEVTEAEERGPRGETFIVAKIGLAPRTTAEKENVEIRVLFFDVDSTDQMRPTDAQVTYQWITQVRDWTDPTPKYLAATYLKSRPSRRGAEPLRYGGFLVRIYSDGHLQDERSQPESLVAQLRGDTRPSAMPANPAASATPANAAASPAIPPSSFRPSPSATPAVVQQPPDESGPVRRSPSEGGSSPSSSPTDHRSLVTDPSPNDLPKGIPIPGKPGFVQSPYDPKFLIDVRGFPPGTLVIDPNSNKPFRVP